ncbi:glycosyltransferase [Frankia sp. CNm7]|uniref:Glycosyltransferase n=1 Tax=Frankia nepalensis TaxID=1836974 RepID=A0A937R9W4_9ACTN|nr:glycosyltransferase family 2 protein [Frankia nepalensis]MBL7501235.1 glycosyltransferase [Frankia nepalensis]MBL7512784.1 glycosyltransferase [Frankia nepalensis]MBL7524468.1 glycosyltransferase [Frankia nepalensis]MBL7626407.1 glycosyltransferase [Frankia nepalensis]
MNAAATALSLSAVAVGLPGLGAAAHLGTLALASLAYREPRPRGPVPPVRFLVLIPAHNEQAVLGRTLKAINAAIRPRDRVVVVADRCTDATEKIAREHGADVVVRPEGSEPGRAAARQAGLDHARGLDWDAIVMIDADSVCDAGFFDACERALAGGAQALQTRSEMLLGGGLAAQASVASFALQGVLIPRGRDRLGLLVRLRGTGMVLRRPVVERYSFRAAAGEDRWYGTELGLDGILPRHVESARLRSENVDTWKSAAAQRVRYEAGRMSAAREFVPRLLRRPTAATVEAAVELLTPPFAIAVGSAAAATALAVASGGVPLIIVTSGSLAVLSLTLVTGLLQADAPARTWLALLSAPGYIAWKLAVQARAFAAVRREQDYFPPTART